MSEHQDEKTAGTSCPKCEYDLRGQLGPPMPFTVQCPECGESWVTNDLFAKKPRLPSRVVFVLVALLGLPLSLIALAILLGGNGILIFIVYPGLFAVIAGLHFLATVGMAFRIGTRRNLGSFATTVAAITLLWDGALLLLCLVAASSPIRC